MAKKKKNKHPKIGFERHGVVGLEVMELLSDEKRNPQDYVEMQGVQVKVTSQRYPVFKRSLKCCVDGCENVGSFFAIERPVFPPTAKYHLNLYALDKEGKEVLMTKDHIIPRSKGGKNIQSNYQTMCTLCNAKKGNKLEDGSIG
jgi:5-methylcytosine-specific restriction endonuclease McrA